MKQRKIVKTIKELVCIQVDCSLVLGWNWQKLNLDSACSSSNDWTATEMAIKKTFFFKSDRKWVAQLILQQSGWPANTVGFRRRSKWCVVWHYWCHHDVKLYVGLADISMALDNTMWAFCWYKYDDIAWCVWLMLAKSFWWCQFIDIIMLALAINTKF